MLERLVRSRPSRVLGAAVAAFAVLGMAQTAQAQIGLNVAKVCPEPLVEGAPLDCEAQTLWENDISNAPVVIRSAVDEVPAPGGVVLPMAVAQPSTPELNPGGTDGAVQGNAACSGACDPVTGAGCVLPCIVCEALDPSVVDLDGSGEGGGTLTCPGLDQAGEIHFIDSRPAPECPVEGEIEDQVTINARNACEGVGVPPDLTCGELPNNLQANDLTTCRVEQEEFANYKCYAAKPKAGTQFSSFEVTLTDQFTGEVTTEVLQPLELCAPVRKEGIETEEPDEALLDPEAAHLMCYKLVGTTLGPDATVRVTDQFGSETLLASDADVLCQPALKNCVENPDEEVDCNLEEDAAAVQAHLKCYQAFDAETPASVCSESAQICTSDEDCEGETNLCEPLPPGVDFAPPQTLLLTDQFGTTDSDLEQTRFHCNPVTEKAVAGGDPETLPVPQWATPIPLPAVPEGIEPPQDVHYKCYDLSDVAPPEGVDPVATVSVQDQFGVRDITIGAATRLCEPTVKELLELEAEETSRCGSGATQALMVLVVPLGFAFRRRIRKARQG